MTSYEIVKLLHILSATVLFGTGLGTAFVVWNANRGGDVAAVAFATRHAVLADWLFTTPAVIGVSIQPGNRSVYPDRSGQPEHSCLRHELPRDGFAPYI